MEPAPRDTYSTHPLILPRELNLNPQYHFHRAKRQYKPVRTPCNPQTPFSLASPKSSHTHMPINQSEPACQPAYLPWFCFFHY